jgi:hypothetical protein
MASPMDTSTISFFLLKFTPSIITLDVFLNELSRLNKCVHFEDFEEIIK